MWMTSARFGDAMTDIVVIDGENLNAADILNLARGRKKAVFPENARMKVELARQTVLGIIDRGETAYGINTGFGSLSTESINPQDLQLLQANLIRSHACALGEDMHPEDVLSMMVIRANSLAKGHSGVRPLVIDLLLACIHSSIVPKIPRIGSLGASGDLAPLAHLAMGLMGEGDGYIRSTSGHQDEFFPGWRKIKMSAALKLSGLEPLCLEAKEGLSLINGTAQMSAWLSRGTIEFEHLLLAADIALALSVEGLNGLHDPFDKRLHEVRNQPGQIAMAARIRKLLHGGSIISSNIRKHKVQDSYSLRCSPQVHGPAHEAIIDTNDTLSIELNSATDNPLIFPNPDNPGPHEVVSGGNFHGQILGLAADRLSIIAHELAVISERRINQLLDPAWSNLPAYLASNSGLESGLMIVQYVAAAAIAEMHVSGNPATLSNVSVSNNKEDHVSMGATACYKLIQQNVNLSRVIACELICAVEALGHNSEKPSPTLISVIEWIRKMVPKLNGDRSMSEEIQCVSKALLEGQLTQSVSSILDLD